MYIVQYWCNWINKNCAAIDATPHVSVSGDKLNDMYLNAHNRWNNSSLIALWIKKECVRLNWIFWNGKITNKIVWKKASFIIALASFKLRFCHQLLFSLKFRGNFRVFFWHILDNNRWRSHSKRERNRLNSHLAHVHAFKLSRKKATRGGCLGFKSAWLSKFPQE